jgi:serine/threonine-protein kinase RsbT
VVDPITINIVLEQDIVVARQKGRALAKELGFNIVDQCRIATCISELARNIFHYAQEGIVQLRFINSDNRLGIEIVAEDQGPGINDINLAMLDGYSTSQGLGMGLPGTRRLMDEFFLNSEAGKGTIVTVRKWIDPGRLM